jgi:hypothetical protein
MDSEESTCDCECHHRFVTLRHCVACDPDVAPVAPAGCDHSWDPVHYLTEGIDTIVCPRCNKTLEIKAVEFYDNPPVFPEA